MAKEEQVNEAAEKKGSISTLKIVIISVVLALIVGGGLVGTTFYFVSNMNNEHTPTATPKDYADEPAEEVDEEADSDPVPGAPAQYFSMDPKFVVSFSNQKNARFMQFSVEIMTRNKEAIKQIETHMPVIRSGLLLLVGSQTFEVMSTREGKQQLLNDIASEINSILGKITGNKKMESAVEAAYFDSFVIQ